MKINEFKNELKYITTWFNCSIDKQNKLIYLRYVKDGKIYNKTYSKKQIKDNDYIKLELQIIKEQR